MDKTIINHFFSKVETKGPTPAHMPHLGQCHTWKNGTNHGYGVFWYNGKNVKAHRFAFEMVNGSIPSGMDVCHHCDNKKCVRPSHLFLGTQQDNTNDYIKKGFYNPKTGEHHGMAVLSEKDIIKIRTLYTNTAKTLSEISTMFGVSCTQISRIIHGKSWNCVSKMQIPQRLKPKGKEKTPNRVTQEMLCTIKKLWKTGKYTQTKIGSIVNIDQSFISRIVNGISLKH